MSARSARNSDAVNARTVPFVLRDRREAETREPGVMVISVRIVSGEGIVPTKPTGGRGGIRTHGEFNPTLDFESSALNRTQPPFLLLFPTAFDLAREWKPAQAVIELAHALAERKLL